MSDAPQRSGPLGPLRLGDLFPPVATTEWQAAIALDLKGQAYESRLVWRPGDGLAVKPFHRSEDLEPLRDRLSGVTPHVAAGPPWEAREAAEWPADAIRADLVHDAGATTAQELGWALAEAVDRIAKEIDAGVPLEDTVSGLSFVFAVGSTYFLEIAKLRAARLLWAEVLDAFAPGTSPQISMRLHVRTSRANKSVYDPYTNLLRVTTEAMSAAIGGADSLLVEPCGFDAHLAINVQHILADEAHLGSVADPAAGSYLIETLTDDLARAGWALLQRIEAAGGYAAAIRDGLLTEQLQSARAASQEAVATRQRTLVGVNDYPDPTDTAPAPGPFPSGEGVGPLAPIRLAAPFEAIRARTARHAAATGRVPVVYLLTHGDVRQRTARASFCRNLFGCAALTIAQGEALPVSADLVVLCSADDEYGALAADVVPAVGVPVLVAGYPAAHVAALTAAGVQGFVHARSDVAQTLASWQDRLGMAR